MAPPLSKRPRMTLEVDGDGPISDTATTRAIKNAHELVVCKTLEVYESMHSLAHRTLVLDYMICALKYRLFPMMRFPHKVDSQQIKIFVLSHTNLQLYVNSSPMDVFLYTEVIRLFEIMVSNPDFKRFYYTRYINSN